MKEVHPSESMVFQEIPKSMGLVLLFMIWPVTVKIGSNLRLKSNLISSKRRIKIRKIKLKLSMMLLIRMILMKQKTI